MISEAHEHPKSAEPYPPLAAVEWVDTTNIATWENLSDVGDWAKEGGFVCRNVGYLVHEDDDCVVLAARIAIEAEPQQIGLFERIPKGVIRGRWTLGENLVWSYAPRGPES